MQIFVTGGCGVIGRLLLPELPGKITCHDLEKCPSLPSKATYIQGDLNDTHTLSSLMQGTDVLVHLASDSNLTASWQSVLHNNITATYSVLEAAHNVGVERIIYASSNHVVGMLEKNNKPTIYYPGHNIMIDEDTLPCPDSYYGVSKTFGENIGRFYAENGGPRFYALRIGATLPTDEDHPYAYAERAVRDGHAQRGDKLYRELVGRLKGLWLSRFDCIQLFHSLISYNGPSFDVFNGVSANTSRWLSIEKAREKLGYKPQDNGDDWTSPPE